MSSVADLIDEASLRKLATPVNFRLGQQIAEEGTVEFHEVGPQKVAATVRPVGGLARKVELISTAEGLRWKCSCTSRTARLCKHGVATALATETRAPDSRQ